MTISSETRVTVPTIGNGVTINVPFAFKVFAASDLLVVQTTDLGVESNLVLNTNYTVSLNLDQDVSPGGSINYIVAGVPTVIPTNYLITISSKIPYLQATQLSNAGGFYPKIINASLDRLTIFVQQVLNLVNRSIKIPLSDGTAITTILPTKTLRANKYISFDSSGNVTVDNAPTAAANAAANTAIAQAATATAQAVIATNQANAAIASVAAANYRFCGTATGTANALLLTPSVALVSYTGSLLDFTIAAANTTEAVSVNVSGLGVKNLKQNFKGTKVDPAIGMLQIGMNIITAYDGTDLIIVNAPWDSQASDIAAAATVALASTTGNFANLTGTGGPITAITGLTKGRQFMFRHTGGQTLTNSATLVLLGGANIVTAVGDISEWASDGTNVYMTRYERISGSPLVISSANGGQLGGFRNRVLNGALRFWQRNTTFACGAAIMTADNFFAMRSGAAAGGTISRQTDVPSGAGFKYSAKVQRDSGNSSTATVEFNGMFESDNIADFAGNTVMVSFFAKKGANYSAASNLLNVNLRTGTGLDQAASGYATWTGFASVAGSVTLSTSWQLFTVPVIVPAGVTEALLQFSMTPVGTAGADDSFYVTGIQNEIGAVATPFERRPYAMELNLCQYHYEKSFDQNTVPAQNAGGTNVVSYTQCVAASTVMFSHYTKFDAEKRATPAVTTFNPAAANAQVRNGNTGTDCAGTALGTVSTHGFGLHTTTPAASAAGNGLTFHYTAEAANL